MHKKGISFIVSIWVFLFYGEQAALAEMGLKETKPLSHQRQLNDFDEPKLNQLKDIDFRLNSSKDGIILIHLDTITSAVDIKKNTQGLSVQLFDTKVTDEKLYVLDVKDFATSVDNIEVFRDGRHARLQVRIHGDFSYEYQLKDARLEIKVTAIQTEKSRIEQNSKPLMGKENAPISINFQDIPVRNVLQIIADYNGFNLVVSDSVTGNITLRLDGVPWQKMLDIILQLKGLDQYIEDNVILIAPKSELDEQKKRRLQQAKEENELGKLIFKLLPINFAKASEIAMMIRGEQQGSMLSSRGSITVDERTNSLLVRDLTANIDTIQEIVASLDVPVKQVQIEARIVTINEGNLQDLGIRWGLSKNNGSLSTGGRIESLFEQGGNESDGNSGGNLSPIDDFLNVNLAATSGNAASIAFQVAKLGSNTLLDLELSALQAESKAEIISNPRLITTNKQAAYIEQGSEIPYLEAASSGATSVSFKKAVLSLKVTPQITPDNRLVLDLSVTQDRPGAVVKTGEGEAVAIDTQRIGTQVLVNDGETVVLGGIYQYSVQTSVDKVPLLGDIPYLGSLFRRSYENHGKSELLIFVTPKVLVN